MRISIGTVSWLACLVLGSVLPAQSMCPSEWTPNAFTTTGISGTIYTSCIHDDGTGPALYVGGTFQAAGGLPALCIARWNGVSWSALGAGLWGLVYALATFDDGTGPALYAAGNFTLAGGSPAQGIAKWNGTTWSPLASGLSGASPGPGGVTAGISLAVHDDGTGPALYVGGSFSAAGGVAASNVARWNGASWSALGLGTSHTVRALLSFDAGAGPELFATGDFDHADAIQAKRVARWNGAAWLPLGNGLGVLSSLYDFSKGFALASWDDGSGPALYLGGTFETAGSVPASNIARFQAGTWSALGAGSTHPVGALATFDDGTGTALVATNPVTTSPVAQSNLRKWDGGTWTTFTPTVTAGFASLTRIAGVPHDVLVVGGTFSISGLANGIMLWNAGWTPIGAAAGSVNGTVHALHAFDDGNGPALYAGGWFSTAAGATTGCVARWDGTAWSDTGAGLGTNGGMLAFATHDAGSGPELYAGGLFSGFNGAELVSGIARRGPTGWHAVGGGIPPGTGSVRALAVFDDGTGPALYAGGAFSTIGSISANNVAKWNGTAWTPLGSGTTGPVDVMVVHDDGTGPALYVGGEFGGAGGAGTFIARWSGSAWSSLALGLNAPVLSLATFDEGAGPVLFAGGKFQASGGQPVARIARWNGSAWSQVGGGMTGPSVGNDGVFALRVYDDGSGLALHAAGWFSSAGGLPAGNVARWNGVAWTPVATGLTLPVRAIAPIDFGEGPALIFGGEFLTLNGLGAEYLARFAPRRPSIGFYPMPGSGIVITTSHLVAGHEYYDLFSLEPAPGGLGTGPYLGLWTADVASLLQQFALPIGSLPFHFLAGTSSHAFGPYWLPPGIAVEGICFDFTGGQLGCVSTVRSITAQ